MFVPSFRDVEYFLFFFFHLWGGGGQVVEMIQVHASASEINIAFGKLYPLGPNLGNLGDSHGVGR